MCIFLVLGVRGIFHSQGRPCQRKRIQSFHIFYAIIHVISEAFQYGGGGGGDSQSPFTTHTEFIGAILLALLPATTGQ